MIEIDGQPIAAIGRARLIQEVEQLRERVELQESWMRDAAKISQRADAALRESGMIIKELQASNVRLAREVMVRDVALVGATETIAELEHEFALASVASREPVYAMGEERMERAR